MAGWTFKNALAAIQSPPSIPFTILLSKDGLRLGDIHFAKIQTTLGMWTVMVSVLERWVESRHFNPEHMSPDDCSRSPAILIVLTPNQQGTALTYASVGLIVRWHKGPVGQIEDIPKLIAYVCSQLGEDRPSSPNACKTYCIIIGDYGGCMGFATELPFCMAYLLSFADRDDPMWMTFLHPCNHPCSFTADVLLVRQLLTQDCTPREYEDGRCRRLLIPRGIHFSEDLFPKITVPQPHAEPVPDPQSGIVTPIFNVGHFASTDTLFTSTAGDLDLFTDMEISGLVRIGLLKPPIAGICDTPAAPVEPASSSGRRDCRDSPGHRHCHLVSAAAGSHDDLDRSEHEREAARK